MVRGRSWVRIPSSAPPSHRNKFHLIIVPVIYLDRNNYVLNTFTMAKKILTKVKLQCEAGKANPAPPVGTALGPHGIQIMDFCNQFNAKTKEMAGNVIPTVITIYADRSFDFIIKQPPASGLIKKAAGIDKGSSVPNKEKVGRLTKAQVKEIAEQKMPDLNANDIESAMKIIEGTAANMGVEIINGSNGK